MSRPSEVGPYQQTSKRPDRDEDGVRTLAITQNITIDGAIEMIDTWFDPETHASEEMSDVLEEIRRQAAWAKTFGLPMEIVSADEAQALFPPMSTDGVLAAAYIADDGYLDPSQLTFSLAEGARVEFDVVQGPKGPQADGVRIVS